MIPHRIEGAVPCRSHPFFFRTAVLLAIAGIALGIFMGMNQDFRLAHMHAHLNLLGWVSFFIFGGYYALAPQAAEGALPKVHYALCLTGLIAFLAGLTSVALQSDATLVALAVVGSFLILAGFVVFALIVFRTRLGRQKSEDGSRRSEYPAASRL